MIICTSLSLVAARSVMGCSTTYTWDVRLLIHGMFDYLYMGCSTTLCVAVSLSLMFVSEELIAARILFVKKSRN